MRVDQLVPGMQFESKLENHPGTITFITSCPHPYYLLQRLVIWIMPGGQIMMDALLANCQIDMELLPGKSVVWRENLGRVLKLTGERST